MVPDVVSALYRGGYRIEVVFADGKRGVVDFASDLGRMGVFERFQDIDFFRAFRVNPEPGTLTWNDEVDIALESLYAHATGSPLPDWTTATAAADRL